MEQVEELRDKYSFKIDRIMSDVDQVSITGTVWDDPKKIEKALNELEPYLDQYRDRVRGFILKLNDEIEAAKAKKIDLADFKKSKK